MQAEIEDLAAMKVAQHFSEYTEEERASWSAEIVELVLKDPGLQAPSEDFVFYFVRNVVSRVVPSEFKVRLWQKVRFGCLSPSVLVEAAHVEEIPRELFIFLAAARQCLPPLSTHKELNLFEASLLSLKFVDLDVSWMGVQHFVPRKCATLKCAYVYGYQCDAKGVAAAALHFRGRRLCDALRLIGCVVESINFVDAVILDEDLDLFNQFDVVILGIDNFVQGTDILEPFSSQMKKQAVDLVQHIVRFVQQGGGLLSLSRVHPKAFEDAGMIYPLKKVQRITVSHDSDDYVSRAELGQAADGRSRSLQLLINNHPIFQHVDVASFRTTAPEPMLTLEGARIIARWSTGEPAVAESPCGRIVVALTTGEPGSISSTTAVPESCLRLWVDIVLYLGKSRQDSGS
eukprot:gnl/TRDRNA2_/TRDRNA2_207691_c0_seq1.p1 gnl/TRDRNA2_/TRDRNA2_207691_c0~~gnl/TRDRNA2_/TRDRNA2_207691_c0_seq1.p1  ORF type:complete len:459 (-),score=63.06 gnl/TRDRNA2_/TRDRNA2_207691_c0_seq1:141-1346(-)